MPRRKTSETLPSGRELWNTPSMLEQPPTLKMSGDPPVSQNTKDEKEVAPPIAPKD